MILHYRPIFIAFISLAFGIWLSKLYYYDSPWILYSVLIIFGVLFIFVLLNFIIKNNKFFAVFGKIKWQLLTMIIPIALGVGLYHITYNQLLLDFKPAYNQTYGIYGTIATNYIEKEKGIYFILENVKVIEERDVHTLKDNVFVYVLYEDEKFTDEELASILPGNELIVTANLSASPVFAKNEINTFAYKNHYQYTAYTHLQDLQIFPGQMEFWDSVREYIRGIYKQYMSEEYAGLAFSVLVGDRTELPNDISNNFQITGIMHVIAVSGLNTAFIMLLLMWLLNKMRAKKFVKLSVVIVVLVFYALLCDMTPSVVRASMMSVFLLFGKLFGNQQDNLNSISLSGIILLLFCPLYTFDLSFLLSYAGVFGIFLLYKPLSESMAKCAKYKCRKLTDAIALTLSASIATTPITINTFEYVSLIGLVANLILVPLFGYAFMLLFVITIFAMIVPFVGYLLTLAQYGFWVTDKGAQILASVPYASISVKPIADWALAGFYMSMFYSSRYCVARKAIKVPLIISSGLIFMVGFVLSFFN